jgi:hypothetical protein
LPWRGPHDGHEFPTLGYEVGGWIQENCVIPDGLHQGEPYMLTDEMWRFLVFYYRLHPDALPGDPRPSAPFFYRGALLMRPQKWGKDPFAAAICCAHAFAPCELFDGWDARGEPVGRPQPTPWIQLVATSEEQTDNTWLALYEMVTRGPLVDFPGVDIGIEDINLPGGGKIEPRTSSGDARLGARTTKDVFGETHLMLKSNGGVTLATNMKRNLSGMGGRWLEITNAYDPSQRSVAQLTHESVVLEHVEDVLIDYRPAPRRPNLADDKDSMELLRIVYGNSWWVDLDRILADARDPGVCPTEGEAMRYFFNLIEVGVSVAVDPTIWAARARLGEQLAPGEAIALGFDGSRAMDCTSIVASRLSDGRWFHLRTWDPAKCEGHRIPRTQVDAVLTAAFEAYEVRKFYGDPYKWQEYFDVWTARWGKETVLEFPTNVDRRMDDAIVRFQTVFKEDFTHDGDPILAAHAMAAALATGKRKQPRPEEDPSIVQHFYKVIKLDTRPIDAYIAGLLAEAARGQALKEGASGYRWTVL